AEIDDTVDLGNFGGVLGPAGLEEFGHPRQTAGDVLGLGGFARRLGHECAGDNFVPFGHDDMRAGRNRVIGGGFTVVIEDDDLRVQILFVLDDDHGLLARGLVRFLLHGDPFDDVGKFHFAGFLGENRDIIRVPLNEGFTLFDLAAVFDGDHGADNDRVLFEFATVVGQDGDGAVFIEDDVVAVFEFDEAELVVTQDALVFGLDLWLLELALGNTAD